MATNNAWNSSKPVPVADGGTGASSLTSHGMLVGHGTSAVTSLVLTDGQLHIGSTGNDPSAATLTAGTGITITNGSGSITIASTGAMTWTVVSGTTQTLAASNGYFSNNAGVVTFTLPVSASVGDVFRVAGLGAGGWAIAQNASQLIHLGSSVTTTGTGGSLASTNAFDAIEFVCAVANTTFVVVNGPQGNITVV